MSRWIIKAIWTVTCQFKFQSIFLGKDFTYEKKSIYFFPFCTAVLTIHASFGGRQGQSFNYNISCIAKFKFHPIGILPCLPHTWNVTHLPTFLLIIYHVFSVGAIIPNWSIYFLLGKTFRPKFAMTCYNPYPKGNTIAISKNSNFTSTSNKLWSNLRESAIKRCKNIWSLCYFFSIQIILFYFSVIYGILKSLSPFWLWSHINIQKYTNDFFRVN